MTEADWWELAEARLTDATTLLENGRGAAAYYLGGYALEAALKARITRYVAQNPGVVFESRKFLKLCWTHNFEDLFEAARLNQLFSDDLERRAKLKANWSVAKEWSESVRYSSANMPVSKARDLIEAINSSPFGIKTWLESN